MGIKPKLIKCEIKSYYFMAGQQQLFGKMRANETATTCNEICVQFREAKLTKLTLQARHNRDAVAIINR